MRPKSIPYWKGDMDTRVQARRHFQFSSNPVPVEASGMMAAQGGEDGRQRKALGVLAGGGLGEEVLKATCNLLIENVMAASRHEINVPSHSVANHTPGTSNLDMDDLRSTPDSL
jgi:hypothetical protein